MSDNEDENWLPEYGLWYEELARGVEYIWNTKLHQMVMDEFIMLKKHADYPLIIPMGLLDLETQGSML